MQVVNTDAATNTNDDKSNAKMLSIPFEWYKRYVGYGVGPKQVETKAHAIKSNLNMARSSVNFSSG